MLDIIIMRNNIQKTMNIRVHDFFELVSSFSSEITRNVISSSSIF